MSYLFITLGSLQKYLDERFLLDGICHVFNCLEWILDNSTAEYGNIIGRKLEEYGKWLKMAPGTRRTYEERYSNFQIKLFNKALYQAGQVVPKQLNFKEIVDLYKKSEKCLIVQDIVKLQDVLEKYIVGLLDMVTDDYETLIQYSNDMKYLYPCLEHKHTAGVSHSKQTELRSRVKDIRGKVVENLGREYGLFIKDKNIYESIMKAIEILEKKPGVGREIISEAKMSIIKNPVLHFFLSKIIRMKVSGLSERQKDEIEGLRPQFGFLAEE
jgi:hypothetical protein